MDPKVKKLLEWVVDSVQLHRGGFEQYVEFPELVQAIGSIFNLDPKIVQMILEEGSLDDLPSINSSE